MKTFEQAAAEQGFNISRWEVADVIADMMGQQRKPTFRFVRGTVHGLVEAGDDLRIIAVGNEEINNGQFSQVVQDLESVADAIGKELLVIEFWNKRLCEWFRRRGYRISRSKHLGLHARRLRHAA